MEESKKIFISYRDSLLAKVNEGTSEIEFGEVGEFVRGPFGGSLKKNILNEKKKKLMIFEKYI